MEQKMKSKTINTALLGSVSTAALIAISVNAYGVDEPTIEFLDVERIQVIGERTDRSKVPGSATRLSQEDLDTFKYQDILRTLRMVPGVNIQEEDGYGLRPNIGLRGSGVERSSKITLMEDGVLIAPAPYAAPAAYYFPTAVRMQAVEVRKGSAAVKFGPRSVGGAVNLVSRSIPKEFGGFADLRVGSDDLFVTHSVIGGSGKNIGGVVEFFRSNNDGFKELPGGGDTGFDVKDYLAKFRVKTDEDVAIPQSIEIKFSRTNGFSNETYLGLTDTDFATNPNMRYAASALDNIDTKHDQIQLTHQARIGNVELVTTAYRNTFERDWFKLHDLKNTTDACGSSSGAFVLANPDICATELSWLRGEADSAEGAIRIRHNARTYEAKGIQSLVAVPFSTEGAEHDLEFSIRYHEDNEDRLQFNERYSMVDGALVFSSADNLGAAGNRLVEAKAWAFFAQDTITVGGWTFVPGVRFEAIQLNRMDWTDDADRLTEGKGKPEVKVNAFVPGIGVSYRYSDNLTITGGLFKGFNPPGAGNPEAKEESSLNVEAGLIYDRNGFYAEGILFYSDYNNILGDCTAASGQPGQCDIGDQFNGGAARVYGLELLGGYNVDLRGSWTMPLSFNYTYTDSEFSTSFSDSFWGEVTQGDHFPYLARHQLTMAAGLASENLSTTIQANYVSSTRTQPGVGEIFNAEKVGGRVVVDISANYQLSDDIGLFLSVDNLFDKTYAVSRRPMGLLPGKPRTVTGGVKYSF
jgi:Fe(3+) dicitrate transport protein